MKGGALVLGLGQEMGGDDAVGPAVIRALAGWSSADASELRLKAVHDASALIDALVAMPGKGTVVIVDAVVGGGEPGDVVCLTGDELCAKAEGARTMPVSSHGLSIGDAVAVARALGAEHEILLVGVVIEPGSTSSPGMSPRTAAAVGEAARRVREILGRLDRSGAPRRPRPHPGAQGR